MVVSPVNSYPFYPHPAAVASSAYTAAAPSGRMAASWDSIWMAVAGSPPLPYTPPAGAPMAPPVSTVPSTQWLAGTPGNNSPDYYGYARPYNPVSTVPTQAQPPYHPGPVSYLSAVSAPDSTNPYPDAPSTDGSVPDYSANSTLSSNQSPSAVAEATQKHPPSAAGKFLLTMYPLAASVGGVGELLAWLGSRKGSELAKTLKPALPTIAKATRGTLTAAFLFGALNDAVAGVTNKQPSMLLGGLLQFIPAAMMATATTNIKKSVSVNAWVLAAGLWFLGFANAIANQNISPNDPRQRSYDMTRFQNALQPSSHWPLGKRLTTLTSELAHMLAFSVADHKHFAHALLHPSNSPELDQHPSNRLPNNPLYQRIFEPSPYVARLSVLFTYLGAIPFLFLGGKALRHAQTAKLASSTLATTARHRYTGFIQTSNTLKTAALLLAELSLFKLALNRKDAVGKVPILGVPLTVYGVPTSHNPFQVAIGQIGSALNSFFYRDMALNGLPDHVPEKAIKKHEILNPHALQFGHAQKS
ncbi:MAG: hypothetical protein KC475_03320 [Cyanobacteria bacterium HKST-UBA03]|nr:hypothetical protein [Cyanobacteria bacterium HKST-UBA03]